MRALHIWHPRPDEAGMAMVLVVVIGAVLVLLGTAAFTMADGALTSSTGHVNFERSLHLAEEGIDQTLARLQKDKDYNTGHAVPSLGFADSDAEETWARGELASVPDVCTPPSTNCIQQTDRGEFAVVKPAGRNVIYAAAWVPTRDEARRQRVLKAEYIFSTWAPTAAIVTGSDLEFGGNAIVYNGSVHSNGDVTANGSSWKVPDGDFTATGSATPGSVAVGQVGGQWGGERPPHYVPPIRPRSMWDQHHVTHVNSWYDLCDDGAYGQVRKPDGAAPCLGTVVQTLENSGAFKTFRGWGYNKTKKTWEYNGAGDQHGVYYAYRAGVSIGGTPGTDATPWQASVFTEGVLATPCNQYPVDIEIVGGPKMTPWISGLQLISGGDIYKGGGAQSAKFQGLLGATEQVYISGTVELKGAIIAEDRCDTTGSKIDSPKINHFSGNMTLTYDPILDLAVDPYIRTTLWLEL